MTAISPQRLDDLTRLAALKIAKPTAFYRPSSRMQESLHASRHRIRAMFVGNRSGKSIGMAREVQGQADHPKSVIVWVCPQFKQFDALRADFEKIIFDADAEYVTDDFYRWPNGSKCFIIPRERDWQFIQGINPDLVCIDEECPVSLYRELRARGAGLRDTRYLIGATATGGDITWMATDIYEVWARWHAERGMDEEAAMKAQMHPEIWCWPRGGIADNRAMTPEKVAYFQGLSWSNDKERVVRNQGGFVQWIGDAVFDLEVMEWVRTRRKELDTERGMGREGTLEVA